MIVYPIFMTSPLGMAVVLSRYKEDYLQIFEYVSFKLHGVCS